jgi:hypothetical protein
MHDSRCMKLLTFIGLALSVPLIDASAQQSKTAAPSADQLFTTGRFAEAQQLYARAARKNPNDIHAMLQLGQISLLENRLGESQEWLLKALALKPGEADAKIMLAEVFYRQDDFGKAADLLAGLTPRDTDKLKSYQTLFVPKLKSFRGQIPYELQGEGDVLRIKFVKSDPLPLVKVRVNGGAEVLFFTDTGGSELLLDTEFSEELGVKSLGGVQGTFSGGQHAEVGNGRIDSLTLGSWTLKNVPVGMLPLRSLSNGFEIPRLDGCIGTNVLYHFLSTIDYPAEELVLRRKTVPNLEKFQSTITSKDHVIPMWMAGDHFMVAWGQVEKIPPALFFIDTGLAGAGVKLAASAIKAARIILQEHNASVGAGGGGQFTIVPYEVSKVSLGTVHEKNVSGIYDGPFPWENAWGFHVDGMLGHVFFKRYAVTFDFEHMQIVLR